MKQVYILLSLIFGGQLTSLGGFTFETNLRAMTVKPDATRMEMLFPFKNETQDAIEIRKYDAPCSCMSAKLKGGKQTAKGTIVFAPGESGVVKGVFELGNFKGTVDKQIVIWTAGDKEATPSIKLTTRVTIPELVAATPVSLIWKVGEELKPKEIKIKMSGDAPISLIRNECSNANFMYQVKTVKEGREYLVTVTPKSTEKVEFAALRFTTDSKVKRFQTLQTFMTIKP